MKLVIPQMVWHGEKEKILAIAFHPFINLLVTGGSDEKAYENEQNPDDRGHIKQWELKKVADQEIPTFNFLGGLKERLNQESTVNCLKFSPNGQYLASCYDNNNIVLWEQRVTKIFGTNDNRVGWTDFVVLPGHSDQVYDLNWSNCGNYLVSASLDKRAILWDVQKKKLIQMMDGHTSYVQGVFFDPKMKFIITLSQDQSVKVWKSAKQKKLPQYYCAHNLKRLDFKQQPTAAEQAQDPNAPRSFKLFLDENVISTFVRRGDWSPDGSFFILPCAQYATKSTDKLQLGALLYMKYQPEKPALFISTNNKPAIVVKFCPVLFKRESEFSIVDIPYKMVFAIATLNQVLIYSTESTVPLAIFGNIHFMAITEMSFKGSSILGVSSCDGFCSFVFFNKDLGQEYPLEDLPKETRELFQREDYYATHGIVQPVFLENPTEQRTEMTVQPDGQQKKKIIPKMIQQL